MSRDSIGKPFHDSAGRITSGQGYFAKILRRWVRLQYLDRIERNVPSGSRIVEFGCGGGDSWMAANFCVTGLEIAESAASAARKLYADVLVADVCAIPKGNDCFDAAASIFVLEHLEPQAAEKALGELYRILKPGGKLVCVLDLECDHPMLKWVRDRYAKGYYEAFIEAPGHYGLRREAQWEFLITKAGFEINEWLLQSRFPILDHCPWVQLSLSRRFPIWIRFFGLAADRITRVHRVSSIWALAATWLDSITRCFWPKTWAYRLLFVVSKPLGTGTGKV